MTQSTKAFLKYATKLWQTGQYADARLKLDCGAIVSAHKFVLGSSHGGCRFFEKLFEIEDDYEEYRIRLVPEGALRQILNWMYSRKIDITEDNVAEILRTAHYIDCSQVVKMTSDYLSTKIDPENAVGFWRFAAIYQVRELEVKFLKFIDKNWCKVQNEDEYKELEDNEKKELENAIKKIKPVEKIEKYVPPRFWHPPMPWHPPMEIPPFPSMHPFHSLPPFLKRRLAPSAMRRHLEDF